MRLIDADELMKHLGWYNTVNGKSIRAVLAYEIASMQTIDAEPVKRGKFDCVNDDENIYMCTSCGDGTVLDAGMSPEDYGFNFCPYCGAKLDEN